MRTPGDRTRSGRAARRAGTGRSRGAALLLCAAVVLTGCSEQLGDRGGQEGSPPDRISDVDHVEVFRNADQFPNVARICVQGIAFASTSSGGPSLVRVPEWDPVCAGFGAASGPPPTSGPVPTPTSPAPPPPGGTPG